MARNPELHDLPPHMRAQAAAQLSETRALYESEEQILVVDWAHNHEDERLHRLFHVPNGGHRHAAVGRRLKAEGVQAGVPDLWLPVPNERHSGIVIEMKRAQGGRLRESQTDWIEFLNANGWLAMVAFGAKDAKEFLASYLRISV